MNDVNSSVKMAASPGAPEPSPASPCTEQELAQLKLKQLELLGELRAEVLDLQYFLNCVRKGEGDIKTYSGYITKTKKDIDDLIAQLQDGSFVRHIKNIWEQVGFCPLLLTPNADFRPRSSCTISTCLIVVSRIF